MITKEVTLSTGVTVTVAPVPQKVYDVIRMKHPDPPVPILESDKTATGEVMRYENREDPDYQRSMMEAAQARQIAWAEAMLLFGLPDVEAPDGWKPPEDNLVYIDPGWKPREGKKGHKLDYIEWELLRAPGDHQKVIAVIGDLAMIPEEATDAIESTFPGDVEVQRAGEEQTRDTD